MPPLEPPVDVRPVPRQFFKRPVGHLLQPELTGRKGGCLFEDWDPLRPVIATPAAGLNTLKIPHNIANDHLATLPTVRVCIAQSAAELPGLKPPGRQGPSSGNSAPAPQTRAQGATSCPRPRHR